MEISVHPLLTDPVASAFALSQINRAMKTAHDYEIGVHLLERAGLPPHQDRPKNWDQLISLRHALQTTDPDEAILDAGADAPSPWASGMVSLGFRNVLGVNLNIAKATELSGARYQYGDITATGLPAASFGYIGCISVIEHGVDLAKFTQEMARLLRSGGYLFVSFDYWSEPIDCTGKNAFGLPFTIFSPERVEQLIQLSSSVGLSVAGDVDLACQERVINWLGLNYTFANLLFCKG
jgi:SAM-dependent methyltransferase